VNIVVSNVKGGVGKTTTSVYLAAAAAARGKEAVFLVDADPQGSSAEWFDASPIDGVELVEARRSGRWAGRSPIPRHS
jgi:chromosome partitioning protein